MLSHNQLPSFHFFDHKMLVCLWMMAELSGSISDGLITQSLRGPTRFLEYHLLFWGLFLYSTSGVLMLPFMLDLSSKPDVEQRHGTIIFNIPISCLLFIKLRENRYFPYTRAYIRIWTFLICHQKSTVCRGTTGRKV